MFIPTRVQFDEAIQIPKIRLKVNDPELKHGAVEMVPGKIPGPYGMQGGFAIVYKFKTRSGKLRALRVFTRQMEPDIQFRYERMGPYFKANAKSITAEFIYHKAAIAVKNDMGQTQTFPLIEMEWIEGVDLLKKLDELCKKRDRTAIGKLVEEWIALLYTLRQAQIGHGDLSGGNVMVRPDGKLVLVDYDGVYIPDFAGRKPIVLGQPDYQHPDFGKRPFDEWMDDFSALVIYTGLLALQAKPELWDKYAKYQAGKLINENLLFKSEDFQAPNQSAIFQDLYKLGDPKVKAALDELKKACTMPVDVVRLTTTLIDPEYEEKKSLALLEDAIKKDDDEEIVKAWTSKLAQYPPAQSHCPRVELAQRRSTALKKFLAALKTDDDEKIIFDGYDSILDGYGKITATERQRYDLAKARLLALRKVKNALASGDEEKIAADYNPILDNYPKLTPAERQKIAEARQCVEMRNTVRQAIATDDDDQISAVYNPKWVRPWTNFTPAEQQRIELAQKRTAALETFRKALKTDDDEKIVVDYDPTILGGYAKVTADEKKRYELAKKRILALRKVRKALQTGDEQRIVTDYDPILDNYSKLLPPERETIRQAFSCKEMYDQTKQALQLDDDDKILAAYDAKLARLWMTFTKAEQKRIELAKKRTEALTRFRAALKSDDDDKILSAYDVILDNYAKVTPSEQERYTLANKRVDTLKKVRQAISSGDERKIAKAYSPVLDNYAKLLPIEQQKIELARQCVGMFEQLRKAIASDDDEAIIKAYDEKLLRPWMAFTPDEQKRLKLANDRTAALARFRAALQSDDDDKILSTYDVILDNYAKITLNERQRYATARKRVDALNRISQAIASGDEREIAQAYDPILDNYPKLLAVEWQMIDLARQCVEFPNRVRQALQTNDDEKIVDAYDEGKLLRPWTGFTEDECKRIELARQRVELDKQKREALERFQKALVSDDDEKILKDYDSALLDNSPLVNSLQRARLELARKRIRALETLRNAIKTGDEWEIFSNYDPILDGYSKVTAAERQQIELALRCVMMPQLVRPAIQKDDDEEIVRNFRHDLVRPKTGFSDAESQRIELARRRIEALDRFRQALGTGDEREIVRAYNPILDACKNVLPNERQQLQTAQRCVEMPGRFKAAIAANDDERIVAEYDPQYERPWSGITQTDKERYKRAKTRIEFRDKIIRAVEVGNIEEANRLFAQVGEPIVHPLISDALARFIRHRDPDDLYVELWSTEFTARWKWHPEAGNVVIVWRTDRMPASPNESGASIRYVSRAEYDRTNGIACVLPTSANQVYVRIFSAIRDNKPYPANNWLYSAGANPKTRFTASRSSQITYQVLPTSDKRGKQLVIQTEDGSPLPELVLVQKQDKYIPVSVNDGTIVFKHKPIQSMPQNRLDVVVEPTWSEASLRLFVRQNDQWVALGGKIPIASDCTQD